MTCPRCKRKQDILAFTPLMQIPRFAAETNPIYKCPKCLWIFSPADPVVIAEGPLKVEVA